MAIKIAAVIAEYHKELADEMIGAAKAAAKESGADIYATIAVPTTLEIPFAAKLLFEAGKADAIIVLGFVERGETMHGEVIGKEVARKLLDLSLEYDMPMGYGIIGPGATHEQAHGRTYTFAENAVRAAVAMYQVKKEFKK